MDKCIVIAKKRFPYSTSHQNWEIKCEYNVANNKYETDLLEDEDNKYEIGDTLDLIYSKDFPKIYEIGYQWTGK